MQSEVIFTHNILSFMVKWTPPPGLAERMPGGGCKWFFSNNPIPKVSI